MNEVVLRDGEVSAGQLVTKDDADLFLRIYQRLNAKNRSTGRSYKNNIIVEFGDIEELHHKTIQSIMALKPAKSAVTVRVTVAHTQGEADEFSSFEEFKTYNVTSPNPTAEIILTYVFSLYEEEKETFDSYEVGHRLRSRLAELSQIEQESPPFMSPAIIASFVTTTAQTRIEYGDYVKARHFVAMFDEWIRGCKESQENKFFQLMKPFSHFIPNIGKILIYLLMGWFTASAIDASLSSIELGVKFLVIYASIFIVVRGLTDISLTRVERAIDSYLSISYLKINKGDDKLVERFLSRNRSAFYFSILGCFGTFSLGIFSAASYDFIKWLII